MLATIDGLHEATVATKGTASAMSKKRLISAFDSRKDRDHNISEMDHSIRRPAGQRSLRNSLRQ